jgi:hypothetical protein
MSSVVISGNTSGTITLDAPAVAGTTTLTLPATSGTVVTKDTNGITSVNGVQFPATQSASADANTLDDYEEGTWTPAFTSTGATFTYPRGQFGSYCKIGSLVYAQFYVGATAAGTTSNPLTLTGLPFTSVNISVLAQPSASAWVSTATAIAMTVDINATSITFWVQNAGLLFATASQVSGGYLVGNVMYRAA